MRIQDDQGRLFQPGFLGEVPTGNLVWVDQVNGNDSLAVRGRMTVPFKTLTAAKNAAQDGDTIFVLPGEYDENSLLRDLVNWYFLPGAIVRNSAAGSVLAPSGGRVRSFIGGCGEFVNTHVNINSSAISLPAGSGDSDLVIQARRIQSAGSAVAVLASPCSVRLDVLEFISSEGKAIYIEGAEAAVAVTAHDIEVTGLGAYGLAINGGNLDVSARSIRSAGLAAVKILGGTGEVVLRAYEIYAGGAAAVEYSAVNYFPKLTIIGARIVSAWASSYGRAIAIWSEIDDNVVLRLAQCLLLPSGYASESIFANNSTPQNPALIQLSGPCSSNRDAGSNVTFLGGSIWSVDSALT